MALRLPTPNPKRVQDLRTLAARERPLGHMAGHEETCSFVSAHRVHQVLRARYGGQPTANRGPGYIYWQTAEGVMFPLEDPLAVPGTKPVFRTDGTNELFYSYGYVVSLLRRIDEAERVARQNDRRSAMTSSARPHPDSARGTAL